MNPTMKIDTFLGQLNIEYIVIVVGDGDNKIVYSTNQNNKNLSIYKAEHQIVDTKNIGKQYMLFLQGIFTEEANHKKLEKPISFKINIYHDSDKIDQNQKTLNDNWKTKKGDDTND